MKKLRCKIFGHKWKFKDYSNTLEVDGKKSAYIKSRICRRCDRREVTSDSVHWIESQS